MSKLGGSKVFQQGHHACCQAHNQLFMKFLLKSSGYAARARQIYTLCTVGPMHCACTAGSR